MAYQEFEIQYYRAGEPQGDRQPFDPKMEGCGVGEPNEQAAIVAARSHAKTNLAALDGPDSARIFRKGELIAEVDSTNSDEA